MRATIAIFLALSLAPLLGGQAGTLTGHEELLSRLRQLDAAGPRAALEIIGRSTQGRDIPALFLARGRFAGQRQRKPIALVFCQQHGDEPSGKEAALLFSTGFQTNQGAIVPMIGDGDYIVSDSENHASIIQGTLIAKGRAGAGGLVKYEHNDMTDLERKISTLPHDAGKLLVTDGVFSMSGDIVNLPEVVQIAKKYNARVMVDDAHSLGVLGKGGRGTASHFGLDDQVDLIMGTFSKSLASLGGFIAAEKKVIDYLKHHAPAFIFSASMTPAQVAAARASLEIIKNEPELVERVHNNANRVRNGLKELGLRVIDAETPIVSIVIGDDMLTFMFWRKLFDGGVFNNPIIFPATPQGMQLIRMSFMASHEDWQLDFVIEQCGKIAREIGLLKAA